MEPENSFFDILEEVLVDFEANYATIESLQKIIHSLDLLSEKEQLKYGECIDSIRKKISEYGTVNKRLTDKQSDKLFKLILELFQISYRSINSPNWHRTPGNYSQVYSIRETFDVICLDGFMCQSITIIRANNQKYCSVFMLYLRVG